MKKDNQLTFKKIPITELKQLLAAISDHGAQHLDEVEVDLNQTTFLLSGAIEKLDASFMNIHKAVINQQQEIDALIKAMDIPEETYQSIVALREKIAVEVGEAVTGLQFQDMTSQLITGVIKRVDGLRESLEALAIDGKEMNAGQEHEAIINLLNDMNASLNIRHNALLDDSTKSVSQQDMDSGDVELF